MEMPVATVVFYVIILIYCEIEIKRDCRVCLPSSLCYQSLMHCAKLFEEIKWCFRGFCYFTGSFYRKKSSFQVIQILF